MKWIILNIMMGIILLGSFILVIWGSWTIFCFLNNIGEFKRKIENEK